MKDKKVFIVWEIEDLAAVAEYLIIHTKNTSKIVLLTGDLGAGKTTFVKQIASLLGSEEDTSSPTYALVNEYLGADGQIYHIDLYRLNDTHEAVDMGIEEYLDSGTYCFIEWPQIIAPLIGEHWSVEIDLLKDGSRSISIQHFQ